MFWIDGAEFPLQSAELVAEVDPGSRRILLSLYVEAREPETGMSLNNISAPGSSPAGLVIRLSDDMRDEHNDLGQSEVSLKGESWNVKNFFLRMGSPRDGRISVELNASCAPSEGGREHTVRLAADVDLSIESERI